MEKGIETGIDDVLGKMFRMSDLLSAQEHPLSGAMLGIVIPTILYKHTQPENPENIYRMGMALYLNGKKEEATQCLRRILTEEIFENHEEKFRYLANIGTFMDGIKAYDEAVLYYKKALEMNEDTIVRFILGKTQHELLKNNLFLEETNEVKEMIKNLEAIIQETPSGFIGQNLNGGDNSLKIIKIESYERLGEIYFRLSKPEQAIDNLKRLIELCPNDVKGHALLGSAYVTNEQPSEALPHFNKMVELNPNTMAYYGLGVCLMQNGKLEEALNAFKKSLELDQDSIYNYAMIGKAYHIFQDTKKANEAYTTFLTIIGNKEQDKLGREEIIKAAIVTNRLIELGEESYREPHARYVKQTIEKGFMTEERINQLIKEPLPTLKH